MSSFHLFPQLPTELRLKIWAMSVEPRLVLLEYCHDARGFLPNYTRPPPLAQVNRESRIVLLDHYVKAFETDNYQNRDRGPGYHWVNFTDDVFIIDYPDIESLDRPEAKLIQHLRVEVGAGNEHHEEIMWLPDLVESFRAVRTLDILIDEPLDEWAYIFDLVRSPRLAPRDIRVVEVREGEWINGENHQEYQDWKAYRVAPQSVLFDSRWTSHLRDWKPKRHIPETCPAKKMDGWSFPPVPSLNWGYDP